jgi:hypothetical protein
LRSHSGGMLLKTSTSWEKFESKQEIGSIVYLRERYN